MDTVNPTRMNFLLKREEVESASTGAELLRNKRDVFLLEFFSCLKPLLTLREALDERACQALRSLIIALGLEGKEKLSSFSFVAPRPPGFRVDYKNLLGLKVPEVVIESGGNEKGEDSVLIDRGLVIEETRDQFQDFLILALKLLPEELKLKRLGREIKSTTRKVNSLEKYVIPQLISQVRFIREALEEREREDVFRLKRLKKHLVK